MDRIQEPVVMNNKLHCEAFANADRKYVENIFLSEMKNHIPVTGKILDLGSGTGDFDIALLSDNKLVDKIIAVDASIHMCDIANSKVKTDKIEIVPKYFSDLKDIDSDVTISSLTLHHQTDPSEFWNTIKKNTKPNGYIFVMDLVRPPNTETIPKVVTYLSSNESELFKIDFANSLAAAFTVDEIKEQLEKANLNLNVNVIGKSDIIMIIYGKNESLK